MRHNWLVKMLNLSPKPAADSHRLWHDCYGIVMRITFILSSVAFLIACGPPPENDPIYGGNGGTKVVPKGGVTSSGGVVTNGGSPAATGGVVAKGGSDNPFGNGGSTTTGGAGGVINSTGGTGGINIITGNGGAASTGGAGPVVAKGTPLPSYSFGADAEPCTPTKDISGGQTGNIGTAAACLRTVDDFNNWNCNGMDDRTIKLNGKVVKCGETVPPKVGSFYYFDITAGVNAWAGMSLFCTVQNCGPHPIPECGHFPVWQSGATNVAPCADSTPSPDAGI